MAVSFDPDKITDSIRSQIMTAVVRATEEVRNEAVRLVLNTEKTGKVYGTRGHRHQASAPGEPWASNTGYALSTVRTSYDESTLTGKVSINAEYGPYLEYGTQKMEPRPVLRPALANMRTRINVILTEAMRKALGGYAGP